MNASATALTRENDVQSKIRLVSTFSRFVRVVLSVVFGFGLVGCVLQFLIGVLGLVSPGPMSGASIFTSQQTVWALPLSAVVVGLWLALVFQLYRLFGNLAAGAIYTSENVRRVRLVGLLWLLAAALRFLLPLAIPALVAIGSAGSSGPPKPELWISWAESLNGLSSAGLILLISWVMDIGLYEKDHAEALKRDADLVI